MADASASLTSRPPVHRQEILAQAALAGAEHPAGGGVDAEHRAAFVQQHQSLLHVGGDLAELVGPAAQIRQLPVDLLALHIERHSKGDSSS